VYWRKKGRQEDTDQKQRINMVPNSNNMDIITNCTNINHFSDSLKTSKHREDHDENLGQYL
jgi:hypothetical protein